MICCRNISPEWPYRRIKAIDERMELTWFLIESYFSKRGTTSSYWNLQRIASTSMVVVVETISINLEDFRTLCQKIHSASCRSVNMLSSWSGWGILPFWLKQGQKVQNHIIFQGFIIWLFFCAISEYSSFTGTAFSIWIEIQIWIILDFVVILVTIRMVKLRSSCGSSGLINEAPNKCSLFK